MSFALKDVSVHFGQTNALDSVSVRFPRSGIVALIGENGAGKSTLLDVLSGFIERSSGDVEDIDTAERMSRSWLRGHCARLHQSIVLPGELTPTDFFDVVRFPERGQCIFGGRARVHADTEIPESFMLLLEKASIDFERSISEHSWGQQRVVGLAAVLMVQRNVLLLDEPFAGLSSDVSAYASGLVQEAARGKLVIFSEHDVPHALTISDTVLVFKAGQLKASVSGDERCWSEVLRYFG